MIDLATFKDNLTKATGDDKSRVVILQESGADVMVGILPPGISVKDLRKFMSTILEDVGEGWNILPESLPLDDLRLASLYFIPSSEEFPFQLEFTLDWVDGHWELIPGVLALEAPSVTITINGRRNPFENYQVVGIIKGVVEIEEIPIAIDIELPSGTFKAELLKEDGSTNKPTSLFNKFQVGSADQSKGNPGIDLGALTLDDLTVMGGVRSRHLLLHLALSNIQLGPGDLATQLTIDYFGGKEGSLSGQIWGEYHIHKKNTKNKIFSLMLAAGYDGTNKSWKFAGGAASASEGDAPSIKTLLEAFTDANNIPAILNDLAIKYLYLTYDTGSGNFEFNCDVEASHLFDEGEDAKDAKVEMIIDVHLQRVEEGDPPTGYDKTFSGRLIFTLESGLQLEFDLFFEKASKEVAFIAAYKNPSGGELSIGDLLRVIDPNVDVPLSIKLQDAFFMYLKRKVEGEPTERSNSLFGLDIGGGIDLTALPLVGKMMDKDTRLNFDIQPLIALGKNEGNGYFSEAELAQLHDLVPGGGITLPQQAITEQINLGIHLSLGSTLDLLFELPITLNSKVKNGKKEESKPAEEKLQPKEGNEPTPTSPGTEATTPPPNGGTGATASGIQWIKVLKKFGPVSLNRVGLQFESDTKMIWAYLDAGLALGPLTFTLDGLGVGTPLTTLAPSFRLLGIGLDYHSGPVEIGASFLRMHVEATSVDGNTIPAHDEYSGLAIVKTPTIGLSAIGAYAELPNYKSLFIYGALHAPLGGPAFFFVTGLAAGFGFNRAINVPEISAVGQFPLVNLAVGGAGSPVPAGADGQSNYIHDILDQVRGSIYPMKGQYFLAAGIRFSSFELIDSFALLIVSFGQHFKVDVLGLSTVVIPPPLPEGGQEVSPIAELQLALKAEFNPEEGLLSVDAALTNNSFVLDRNCHITGQFAFRTWFAGPHQGDFVLSLGGYHPDFKKPAHYPTISNRLGMNWQVTPEVSIDGGLYFALCPHALMAGGRLYAIYNSGATNASFILSADFILSWKPFHYDARMKLDVEVHYTSHCCGTHHINTSISADVHVWGPDFAGHAHVHLWCVSFNVDFGAKSRPALRPITWNAFKQSFLPKEESKMIHTSVKDGLVRQDKNAKGELQYEVINPKHFKLGVDLVLPYKTLKIETNDVPVQKLQQTTMHGETQVQVFTKNKSDNYVQATGSNPITPGKFGIAPMACSAESLTSEVTITVEEYADNNWKPANQDFGFRPVLKRMPRALWGEKLQQDINGERYVENALAGLEIVPATAPKPGNTHWLPRKDLQFVTTLVENGKWYIEQVNRFKGIEPQPVQGYIPYIKDHMKGKTIMEKRRNLLEALGFDYDRLGMDLRLSIPDQFVEDPQIGK